ncbi:hypothetical protein [Desulfuromonas acetoxidans]|uniref:Uncharacterized protein n=1 Tax=Desulfuromonas acetoxidans (strain DSM 684 / 11070) TaxID=281689 RepID=Q1K1H0_DESA6|nr:hypothetical protein [Desulfuromonas acetoxidans]EAT16418.1 conserved hypothetical protein [Desulfuromonas acetoxidans DSM 684]MBF0644363.1 hypothetical protein [Desulfuromonas acetoxidans]NVD23557.1 hypothetical protein [Desulfuromonas acetoxidans]NVE16058.1 hypothetical protein [Desulfuromonas acetoxidans]
MDVHPRIENAIAQVVQEQIDTNEPPEVTETLVRLVNEGYPEPEARELIGCVVISEVFDVLKSGESFDLQRYVAALNRLPELPEAKL